MHIPKGYQIKTKFNSKKNQVYLLERQKPLLEPSQLILKIYQKQNNCQTELNWLSHLAQLEVNAPQVVAWGDNWIIMNYISGITLTTKITQLETNSATSANDLLLLAEKLSLWLVRFQQASICYGQSNQPWCHGDLNGRNLLYTPHGFYGIDFENCHPGQLEEDIALLLLYILTCSPPLSVVKNEFILLLQNQLIATLNLNQTLLQTHLKQSLHLLHQRRGAKLPTALDKDIYHLLQI